MKLSDFIWNHTVGVYNRLYNKVYSLPKTQNGRIFGSLERAYRYCIKHDLTTVMYHGNRWFVDEDGLKDDSLPDGMRYIYKK